MKSLLENARWTVKIKPMNEKRFSSRRGGCLGFIIKLLLLIVVLLCAALYFAGNYIVSFSVTNGAKLVGIDAGLKNFMLNPFSQVVSVGDFYVKNPEGFTSGDMLSVKKLYLDLDFSPMQYFSDKLVSIDEINVDGLQVMLEIKGNPKTGLLGSIINPETNLSALQDKLQTSKDGQEEFKKTDASGEEEKPLKLIVKGFKFNDCKVIVAIDGKPVDLVLPSFELKDLGVAQNGLTVTELSLNVVNALTTRAVALYIKNAAKNAGGALEQGGDSVKDAAGKGGESLKDAADSAIKSIKSIFN